MSAVKRHRRQLSESDLADTEFTNERGRVVAFSLNMRSEIEGEWKEVIRYDTSHGRLHVHRFWEEEEDQIQWLEDEANGDKDYSVEFTRAEDDIKRNWRLYRARLGG